MFTWGCANNGRLGYSARDVQQQGGPATYRGVYRPHPVPSLGSRLVVADVACAGYSFAILTGEGAIFVTGELNERYRYPPALAGEDGGGWEFGGRPFLRAIPRAPHAYMPNAPLQHPRGIEVPLHCGVGDRGGLQLDLGANPTPEEAAAQNDKIDYQICYAASELLKRKQLGVNSEKDVKFTSISCGRCHLIALDEAHDVWVWDRMYAAPGVRIQFAFNANEPHGAGNKTVRKLCAGWQYSTALVDGVGLVVWFDTQLQDLPRTKTAQAHNKKEAKAVTVEHIVVPGTNHPLGSDQAVVDVMAGDGFLVYLTSDGSLFGVNTSSAETVLSEARVPLTLFTDALAKLANVTDSRLETARFVKLSGSFQQFAVFSSTDHVLLGSSACVVTSPGTGATGAGRTQQRPQGPTIIPELQQINCLSVAAGDYHFLALLRGGKLLSWGRECQKCGSLGQGPSEELVATKGAVVDHMDVVLDRPTEVEMADGGRVLAIGAGGWHSCAVVTTEEIEL